MSNDTYRLTIELEVPAAIAPTRVVDARRSPHLTPGASGAAGRGQRGPSPVSISPVKVGQPGARR